MLSEDRPGNEGSFYLCAAALPKRPGCPVPFLRENGTTGHSWTGLGDRPVGTLFGTPGTPGTVGGNRTAGGAEWTPPKPLGVPERERGNGERRVVRP